MPSGNNGNDALAVIDASFVTSATLRTDANFNDARRWWEEAHRRRIPLRAPVILLPEYASAVARATGSIQEAQDALAELRADSLLVVQELSIETCERAAEIAATHGIKGCDAIYVALAEQFNEPLVSFDNEQLLRAAPLIRVLRPG